jgi:hypothetical protein
MAEMGTGHGYGGFVNDGLIDEATVELREVVSRGFCGLAVLDLGFLVSFVSGDDRFVIVCREGGREDLVCHGE